LIRDTIEQLALTSISYPGDKTEEGSTPEAWEQYLKEISLLMDKSIDREFEDNQYYVNPYEKEYQEYLNSPDHFKLEELPDGSCKLIDNDTEADKKLKKKYFAENTKIYKQRVKDRNKALDMIKKHWENLWD